MNAMPKPTNQKNGVLFFKRDVADLIRNASERMVTLDHRRTHFLFKFL